MSRDDEETCLDMFRFKGDEIVDPENTQIEDVAVLLH